MIGILKETIQKQAQTHKTRKEMQKYLKSLCLLILQENQANLYESLPELKLGLHAALAVSQLPLLACTFKRECYSEDGAHHGLKEIEQLRA